MAKCDKCNKNVSMPYQCNICGEKYCSDHRLPEKHNCKKLDRKGLSGNEAIKSANYDEAEDSSVTEKLKKKLPSDRSFEYIPDNVSYTLIGIILVVYILQLLTIGVFGINVHNSIFVLNASRIEFVWTWFTSIFAHDTSSIFHLLGNGIVLLFFGPLLEKIIGSKSFLKLFVFSGVVAGLSQILIAMSLGSTIAGVLGASGAILCILGVLTVYKPDMSVYLYFMIPVPLWLITAGYAVFSVIGVLSVGSGIAHMAHLSGLIIGLVYGYKYKDSYDNIYSEKRLGANFRE